MWMGDVAQHSGHEGGETGHGGAGVSAAAAAEGSDVGGSPTCCLCMEPWTDSGAHRICCIPCGHVYGRSCLESWPSRGGRTSAKCPRCGKRSALEHIINLYAPGNLWDRYTCTRCHIQEVEEHHCKIAEFIAGFKELLLQHLSEDQLEGSKLKALVQSPVDIHQAMNMLRSMWGSNSRRYSDLALLVYQNLNGLGEVDPK